MFFIGFMTKRRIVLLLLVVLTIAPLFPFSNYVGHPHWSLIRWIPFEDFYLSKNMLKDVLGNLLWFMMFGYLLHYMVNKHRGSLRTMTTIAVVAGCISLSIEFFQVFCHNLIPSMTDVICDVLGASIGGYFAEKHCVTSATRLALGAIIKSDGSKTLP
jgi:glycopeptide antibiotics resistance protein